MSDMYKLAAQGRLRFSTKRGDLLAEDLFQMPLTSKTGFDLDTLAKEVNRQLKEFGEESFVEDATVSPQKQRLALSLDILKDVIRTRQDENKAALVRRDRQAEIQKIRDLIDQKKNEKLAGASAEELEAKLKALMESA